MASSLHCGTYSFSEASQGAINSLANYTNTNELGGILNFSAKATGDCP